MSEYQASLLELPSCKLRSKRSLRRRIAAAKGARRAFRLVDIVQPKMPEPNDDGNCRSGQESHGALCRHRIAGKWQHSIGNFKTPISPYSQSCISIFFK
jgi:hypothetical protein